MTEYGKEYYQRKANQKDVAGSILVDKLMEEFNPDSVIDLGCGDGRLTKDFEDEGVDILGWDASEAAIEHNVLEQVEQRDLRSVHEFIERPFNFDLAICIEVAEHLEEEYAENLVENVTRASDTVFFTAAKPGQPGKGHVNCRPEEYWIDLFEERGYIYDEELSQDLKEYFQDTRMQRATPWIPRNIMVFRRENE